MAFCNSCGNNLAPGAQFCNKCGAPVGGASPTASAPTGFTPVPTTPTTHVPGAPAAPAAAGGGSSALKIVLIIVAVILCFGILVIVSLGVFIHHFAKNSRIHQEGDHVKVETPFGNVETSADPEQLAKDMGIDIYPGAQVEKNSSATASFGNMKTANAVFTSTDPVDKVCAFYKLRVSNAMAATTDEHHCSFVSTDKSNTLSINVEAQGDGSKIQISSVKKN